jgi:hypothetical protein
MAWCARHCREAERTGTVPTGEPRPAGAAGARGRRPKVYFLQGDGTVCVRASHPFLGRVVFAGISEADLPKVRHVRKWEIEVRDATMYLREIPRDPEAKRHGAYLHRLLMGEPPTDPTTGEVLTVNHIDGNGLNNLRDNLEWATAKQQAENREARRRGEIALRCC